MQSRLKPQVVLLGLAALLNDTASELIYPLLPVFLTTTLGATPAVIGLIEGIADGLASILKYFSGAWSDRVKKRKPMIVSGYALAAGSRLLIAFASVWPMVLAARLIDRTGKGIRGAPRDAMIADVTPSDQRGRAFGFNRALDHTGAILGPLLAVLLLQGLGLSLQTTFLFAVVPGAIGVGMLVFLLHEKKDEGESMKEEPTVAAVAPSLILHPSSFRKAITAIALFSLANSSDAFLLLQAHAAGVSTAMLPLLWAAHHVIKSLFSTRAGALSDRMERRYLLIAGWTIYAVIYALFPFAKTLTSFVVLFVAYAIPFTLTEGAERAWIADLVPREIRGKSFGIYYLANGVCVLIGTAIFGLLYQQVSPAAAFFTGAALALCAVVAVWNARAQADSIIS
ncbi:MAG TPA: MFS transporter [Thermoanaerobaculia bacterium]|jgi:MFS family permease|nr:MFS transporter [Thermoanaerobaculia bacterium]